MKYLLVVLLFLSACENAHVGDWRLISCGPLSGCEHEGLFHTKADCESAAAQLRWAAAYVCEEVK
jgi:hypothetical protein